MFEFQKLAPVENVKVTYKPVERTDEFATVVIQWDCPYLTGKPHIDIVDKFSIASSPNVGDKVKLYCCSPESNHCG